MVEIFPECHDAVRERNFAGRGRRLDVCGRPLAAGKMTAAVGVTGWPASYDKSCPD